MLTGEQPLFFQLNKFDMEMDTELVTITGRCLSPETVYTGRNGNNSKEDDKFEWNQCELDTIF